MGLDALGKKPVNINKAHNVPKQPQLKKKYPKNVLRYFSFS
jgi:hypothetical protein